MYRKGSRAGMQRRESSAEGLSMDFRKGTTVGRRGPRRCGLRGDLHVKVISQRICAAEVDDIMSLDLLRANLSIRLSLT